MKELPITPITQSQVIKVDQAIHL